MCVDLFVLALLKHLFLYFFWSHATSTFKIPFQKASFCPPHRKQTLSMNSLVLCHFWKQITSVNYYLLWFTVAALNYTQAPFCCLMIKVHFPEQSGVITSSYISYLFLKKNPSIGTLPPALLGMVLRQGQVIKPCPQPNLVLHSLEGSLTSLKATPNVSPASYENWCLVRKNTAEECQEWFK